MDIAARFLEFNGKSVAPFRAVAGAVRFSAASLDQLLALAETGEVAFQVGATWVVKHWLENGQTLSPAETARLLKLIETSGSIDAKLHLLQILPMIQVPDHCVSTLYPICKALTGSENKFIRAWAFNALGVLAKVQPGLLQEVMPMLQAALHAEAPSVQARVRHALTALD